MSISDTITVDAGEAISQLNAFAEAAARADAAFAGIGKGGSAGRGAAGMAASMDAAAKKISAAVDKIAASMARLDSLGASGKGAAAGLDSLGTSAGGAEGKLKGLGTSAKGAGDGLKGVGDSARASEAFLAGYNATMAETAALQREVAASSATAAAKIAASQSLQTRVTRDASAEAIAAQKAQAKAAADAAAAAEASQRRWKNAGLAGVAIAAYGVDQAAKLQAGTTRLFTTAGESKKNLPLIEQGILKLAPETATSQSQLLQGAYMAESAGFHGKNALSVLKAGAEGAFAEGAPLGDTINALTSLLNAYGMKGAKAPTSAMNQIIAMVSRGKMTMAGAVSALPTVLPVAASAGLDFGQVGGALSAMTAMGMSPDLAAQGLRHTIGSLQNMSGVQTGEIQQLGGNPVKLEKNLGKTGLLGTLTDINKLVTGSMGKSGTVLMSTFNRSASAAADANKMMSAMPSSIKGMAKAYADGTISAKQWNKEIFSGSESAQQKNLLQQFATVENKAKGFSDLLKSGSPAAQTYQAALSKALGGQTGLQTFLHLEGIHLPAATANTAAVTAAGKRPGADVTGWSDVQKTLKFQLGSAEQGLEAAATQLGKAFLPMATSGLKDLAGLGKFFAGHPAVTKDLGVLGGGILGVKFGSQLATAIGRQLGGIGKLLHLPGADKLSNLGKSTGLDGSAVRLSGAAEALTEAAAKLGGVPGGKPRGEPGTPGAPGERPPGEGTPSEAGEPGARPGSPAPKERFRTGTAGILSTFLFVDPILANTKSGPGGKNWLDNPFGMPGPNDPRSKNNWLTSFAPYERLFSTGRAPSAPAGIPAGTAPAMAARFGPAASAGVTPKIQPPPTGQVTAASAQIAHAMERDLHKPVKVAAPDLSGLTSARGKAQAVSAAIAHAMERDLHKPVKVAAPDLSAYASAAGKARSAGASVSSGFAGGIESGKGAAVAAAADVANAAAAAMAHAVQSRSPSKVTQKIGSDTAKGFEVGLQGGQAAITAAAQAIGKNAAKATDITTIGSNVKKLLADVPKGDTGLTRMLKDDQSRLTSLASQRSKLEQQISDSEDIAKNAISAANITGAADYQPALAAAGGPLSSSATIAGMKSMAADQKQFASTVAQLKKQGLNATSLSQIVQAGPSALPQALGLAQGGKGAIGQVNALEQQIHASAAKLGDVGGPAMFQAGADAAKGLAAGIKSQLGSVDAAMKQLAQHMVSAVKSALKSHSPSLVFAEVGTGIPAGLALGIDQGTGTAMSAVNRMGSRLATAPFRPPAGYGHPAAGGSFGAGGGGAVPVINVTVNVSGHVTTEHDLVGMIQDRILQQANRNWQAGFNLPGRAP